MCEHWRNRQRSPFPGTQLDFPSFHSIKRRLDEAERVAWRPHSDGLRAGTFRPQVSQFVNSGAMLQLKECVIVYVVHVYIRVCACVCVCVCVCVCLNVSHQPPVPRKLALSSFIHLALFPSSHRYWFLAILPVT